jgi:hypothetical protein
MLRDPRVSKIPTIPHMMSPAFPVQFVDAARRGAA